MNKSLLVKIFGFKASLIHADTLVLDRWIWIKRRLPRTMNNEKLLDVGCGSGAFSIGASLRGYNATGLTWDSRDQHVAVERAQFSNAKNCTFEVMDVRQLGENTSHKNIYDVLICMENIEHIINDNKLVQDMFHCLKPGGRLLLSTPYFLNIPISKSDTGPFQKVEDGSHMRKGYTSNMLIELCSNAGLNVEEISYCSGYLSQRITGLYRILCSINPLFAWAFILPFRILPPMFDKLINKIFKYPDYSICLVATKNRF
jgi:2-polyprenyl-3-methyl-5-hydroxy-6-metoxy-1,4-benzoquinol methylase